MGALTARTHRWLDPLEAANNPGAFLVVENVSAAYTAGHMALRQFSCSVARGERVALLGANGSGKTTSLLVLAGALAPNAGTICMPDLALVQTSGALRAWRQRVGLVLADPDDQLIAPTVADDIAFGPRNMGLADADVSLRVGEAVEALGIEALLPRAIHRLSLGERKRVALAGVLALRPDVLLLDEPTTGLDRRGREGLRALLAARRRAGTTILIATHDTDFAWDWADRAIVLEAGRVIASAAPAVVLTDREVLDRAWLDRPAAADRPAGR